MKNYWKIVMLIVFAGIFVVSCQSEDSNTIVNPEALVQSSPLTSMLKEVTFQDDVINIHDDMIDSSSCFRIKLPFEVNVNNNSLLIDSEEDYDTVSLILNQSPDDTDNIALDFPITLVYTNGQELVVGTQEQFNVLQADCDFPDENSPCVSLIYPITIYNYNSDFQFQNTYTMENNAQMYNFLSNLAPTDSYVIEYNVGYVFGAAVSVSNNEELLAGLRHGLENCSPTPNPCGSYVLNEDLVMYIPFANQIEDITGFGNPIPANQDFHYVTDRSGNENAAFSFDTGSPLNIIQTTANESNNLLQNTGFTISFWFNRQNAQATGPEQLYNTNLIEIGLGPDNVAPEIRSPFVFVPGLSDPLFDPEWIQSMTGEINIWHHIVLTYDGQLLKFYRDGILRSASVNAQFTGMTGGGVFGNGFKGYLDDVRMYKRALSNVEVQILNNLPGESNQCLD